MPTAALRPCLEPGCPVLVKRARCDQHSRDRRSLRWQDRTSRSLELGADYRWRKLSARFSAHHPVCGMRQDHQLYADHSRCVRDGIWTAGTQVDHIVPHHGEYALKYDEANLQSLCHSCHSAKTMAESRRG